MGGGEDVFVARVVVVSVVVSTARVATSEVVEVTSSIELVAGALEAAALVADGNWEAMNCRNAANNAGLAWRAAKSASVKNPAVAEGVDVFVFVLEAIFCSRGGVFGEQGDYGE